LGVHLADFGAVGALICWEHWMPLARAAMHNLGEAVHIACWPTVREMHLVASRHYAFEGSCHVLAAGTVLHRDHLLNGLKRVGGGAEAEALLRSLPDAPLQFGGSAIVGPDGDLLAQAGDGEQIITATADLNRNHRARTALDSDGHYSRPDVFALTVNASAQVGVSWRDDGAAG
jgi:predicted amidohydrolase